VTIEDLHRTVVDGFTRVDERFAANDQRFDRMDERFDRMDVRLDRMDERFDRIDERFDRLDERFGRVDAEFGTVREEMRELQVHLEARIREEGETTRRHFNVMVERVEAAVRIVAEGHTHLQSVVDDQEARLQANEKRA
jgi:archaellum component FlaC